MSMTWTIEWVSRLDALRLTVAGEFSASAYRSMLADALANPNWYAGADSLIDYRQCRLDRGIAEMLAAVDVYRGHAEAIGGGGFGAAEHPSNRQKAVIFSRGSHHQEEFS